MNEMITKRNALLAQKVVKGLESRNMTAYYAQTKEEALQKARESEEYRAVSGLFEKDSVKIMKEARSYISRWKNNYRKM